MTQHLILKLPEKGNNYYFYNFFSDRINPKKAFVIDYIFEKEKLIKDNYAFSIKLEFNNHIETIEVFNVPDLKCGGWKMKYTYSKSLNNIFHKCKKISNDDTLKIDDDIKRKIKNYVLFVEKNRIENTI